MRVEHQYLTHSRMRTQNVPPPRAVLWRLPFLLALRSGLVFSGVGLALGHGLASSCGWQLESGACCACSGKHCQTLQSREEHYQRACEPNGKRSITQPGGSRSQRSARTCSPRALDPAAAAGSRPCTPRSSAAPRRTPVDNSQKTGVPMALQKRRSGPNVSNHYKRPIADGGDTKISPAQKKTRSSSICFYKSYSLMFFLVLLVTSIYLYIIFLMVGDTFSLFYSVPHGV